MPGGVGPLTVAMLLAQHPPWRRDCSVAVQTSIGRARIPPSRPEGMIKLGICNELFEGWDFGRVCRTVKELGYDGLEIAPFTLAPRITDLSAGAAARAEGDRRGRRPRDDRPALAAREDRGLLPDDARRRGPARDGRLPGRSGRGDPRPRRLADGARLAQAARPVAGRDL